MVKGFSPFSVVRGRGTRPEKEAKGGTIKKEAIK